MFHQPIRILDLVEWSPAQFALSELSVADVARISQAASKRITVTWSDPQTARVELLSKGWVGTVRCGPDLALRIHPRFLLERLLQLMRWTGYSRPHGLATVPISSYHDPDDALTERFIWLLQGIAADGLHKGYQRRRVDGQVVKGRILVRESMQLRALGQARLAFEQYELTTDLIENRVVLWTAHILLGRTDPASRLHRQLSQFFASMAHWVTLRPVDARECRSIRYDSRTFRYRELHELCGLILEGSSAELGLGTTAASAFGVETSRLFELAVSNSLKQMDGPYRVEPQKSVPLSVGLQFKIDNVVHRSDNGTVIAVLDAKYKDPSDMDTADVQQVVAYAAATKSKNAILAYPMIEGLPESFMVGDIRVSAIALDLARPITDAVALFTLGVFSIVGALEPPVATLKR